MPYRPTERTEARRRERREAILDAALRLVAQGGYAHASVAAVASGAGVATGSVYRHFPSKAELLAEVFRRAAAREVRYTAAAAEEHDGPIPERIAAAAQAFARRALRGRRLAWALLAEPVDPAVERERLRFRRAYRDVFAALLSEGVRDGTLRSQNVELTSAALVGALGEALVGPLSPLAADPEAEDLLTELVGICLRCILITKETRDGHRLAA